jgi:hypothetical protein
VCPECAPTEFTAGLATAQMQPVQPPCGASAVDSSRASTEFGQVVPLRRRSLATSDGHLDQSLDLDGRSSSRNADTVQFRAIQRTFSRWVAVVPMR